MVVSNDFGSITTQPTRSVVDGTPTSHTVASISMDMIFCPPGTFTMGSPTNETGRGGDETQHQVTLSHGFYLGKHEVTQAQYQTVMNGNPSGLSADPSQFKGSNRPVEKASWEDAQIFLCQLNSIEQTAGRITNGLEICSPHGSPMGVCLPGRNYHQHIHGEMISIPPVPIIIGMAVRMMEAILNKPAMWVSMPPTPGAFLTCREMCGNGSATGRRTILLVPRLTLRVRHRARIGSHGVVPGTTAGRTCVLLGASTTPSNRNYNIGFRVGFQPVQPDTANPELELFGGAV